LRSDHLLQIAADPAEANTRRPRRTDLCRAVSTAYHALFHCLARACADALAGKIGPNSNRRSAWRHVYRALDHGEAKKRCRQAATQQLPKEMKDFAETFVSLQRRRHLADYDPDFPFSKSEVIEDIEQAQSVIARFSDVPRDHLRAFTIQVLMKTRADA